MANTEEQYGKDHGDEDRLSPGAVQLKSQYDVLKDIHKTLILIADTLTLAHGYPYEREQPKGEEGDTKKSTLPPTRELRKWING